MRHLIMYIILFLTSMTATAQRDSFHKMSPSVRMLTLRQMKSPSKIQSQQSKEICAFIRVDDDVNSVLEENRCRVLADYDDIKIVSIPMNRISRLASDRHILRIETGRGMSVHNNTFGKYINATPAYNGVNLPQAFTGKGVVVGVMDIGFDLTQPNFYSRDLSDYRIRAMWDMLSADTIDSKQYVGRDYIGRDALLAYQHSRDGLEQLHGSHTLGTAAGSGYDSDYRGVAWESDICLVSNATSDDMEFISDEDEYKYTYATDALGFKYIFDYADSVGKPCVISFSEGSTQDLYGDDLLYYELLERMQGPGRIIVASAGNSGIYDTYFHKPVGRESAGAFMQAYSNTLYFLNQSTGDFDLRLVFYGEQNDTVSISSSWLCQQTDSVAYDTLQIADRQYVMGFGAYPSCYDSSKIVVEAYVQGPDNIGHGNFPVSVETIGMDQDIETFRVYGEFTTKPENPALADAISYCNIGSPGSAPSVICVGSTAYTKSYVNYQGEERVIDYGENGVRGAFSSIGPALNGCIKPDVMAPGVNIVSSNNSFFLEANPDHRIGRDDLYRYEFQGRTYAWRADSGTSMSAPAVGGALALWLEADPTLTYDRIKEILAATCSHPDADAEYPNEYYGYGQIDVYRGLLYILGIDKIEGVSLSQPSKVTASANGDMLTLNFGDALKSSAVISVYTVDGRRILTEKVSAGTIETSIAMPEAVSVVVAVQINSADKNVAGSLLIRL